MLVFNFNYKDLKAGCVEACRTYPSLKDSFRDEVALTMLAHVRMLKMEMKFAEASTCLSGWLNLVSEAGGSKEFSMAKKASEPQRT